MGLKLITGKTGSAHVASADDRARIAAIFGPGEYIADSGNGCFAATIVDNNNISIGAGDLIAFGTHSRIAYGDTESIVIDSGAVGYNRIDLIVADYKNTSGVESCSFKVIKGAASSGTPATPSAVSGNILQGASANQTILYKVTLNGINIVTCEKMIPIVSIPASSVASAFSASATYAVGALVSYGGKLYKCTTAVSVAGAWDSGKWSAVVLADVLSTHTHTPESIGAMPASATPTPAAHASTHDAGASDPLRHPSAAFTVLAASWSGGGYTIPVASVSILSKITANTLIWVQPSEAATKAQCDAWRAALVRHGGQVAETSITLTADGTPPAVNIPVKIILGGELV